MSQPRVAIVGATGAVGEELLRVLEERRFPLSELRLLASPRSAGRTVTFRGEAIEVEALDASAAPAVDIAFFSAGADRSLLAADAFVRAGALVVDNSSAFRMRDDVPLVVPEVNAHDLDEIPAGIVANPNCSTIVIAVAIAPIHRAAGIRRAVVATYQAVSGAGAKGLAELEHQRRALVAGEPLRAEAFAAPIVGNAIPRIGALGDDGLSEEERKIERELRKILGAPALRVHPTCVRVSVDRAHSAAVHLELDRLIDREQMMAVLEAAAGVRCVEADLATPRNASGGDDVLVSRLRADREDGRRWDLWVTGDQLRKGAALNAVQIAEHWLDRRDG